MLFSSNNELVDFLIKEGYLKRPQIIEAFKKIKREDFVPEEIKSQAYINTPLPIGFGQTISQPIVVAFMLELLEPKEGERILDIGSGSGWTTALIAHCLGKKGKVFAVERIKEICLFGKRNVAKYDFLKSDRVKFFCQSGAKGLPEIAKEIDGFDGILSGASSEKIPEEWIEQLKEGGRIVAPVKNSIVFLKKENKKIKKEEFFGFSFVPLIED